MNSRTLKIEMAGDFFGRKTYPKIRIQGRWLERLGFPAGQRVEVTAIAPGVIRMAVTGPKPQFQHSEAI